MAVVAAEAAKDAADASRELKRTIKRSDSQKSPTFSCFLIYLSSACLVIGEVKEVKGVSSRCSLGEVKGQ